MIDLPNPWNDLDSASGLSVADTVAASTHAPVPEAAIGNVIDLLNAAWLAGVEATFNSVSDDDGDCSLPSGESESSVRLAYASSEFSSCDGSNNLPGPSVDSSNGRYDPLDREVEGATSESGPQEATPESARIPARGHLAAGVESFPTPAVFSLAESAVPPGPQITAGDTGETHPLVSSPADDLQKIIALVDPPLAMPNRNRFDTCFDPDAFMVELDPPPIFLNSKSGAK